MAAPCSRPDPASGRPPCGRLAARGQHQNWMCQPSFPDVSTEFDAAAARQRRVENDQVTLLGARPIKNTPVIRCDLDGVTLAGQLFAEDHPQFLFVFHQQDLRIHFQVIELVQEGHSAGGVSARLGQTSPFTMRLFSRPEKFDQAAGIQFN